MDEQKLQAMAKAMRRKIIDISYSCNMSVHLGGGLSMVDIMATLYGAVLNYDPANPASDTRDRFILSKGHGVLGFYSALHAAGILSDEVLATFMTNGSHLVAHPVMNISLGVESSNGSLGQGLAMGIGLALAAKKKGKTHKVYVLLGNGECNEGSVWEAAASAAHFRLDNLVAIVDNNEFQSDGKSEAVMDFRDMGDKWRSFGWDVRQVDGHNIPEIHRGFTESPALGLPKVLVARTVKGKGISFMENNNEWHHNRLTKTSYEKAVFEMEAN
jgi:transketolase